MTKKQSAEDSIDVVQRGHRIRDADQMNVVWEVLVILFQMQVEYGDYVIRQFSHLVAKSKLA
jgi:hypothetical protein